jgi:Tol biopolymer transport system component
MIDCGSAGGWCGGRGGYLDVPFVTRRGKLSRRLTSLSRVRPIRPGVLIVSVAIIGLWMCPWAFARAKVPERPNRDKIAYTIDRKGPNHIYVSDLAGRHPRLLVKGRDPSWSPDGEWLSYRTGNPDRPGGNPTRIHLIRADGSGSRTLDLHLPGEASGEAGPARWSPDGHWLLFDTLGGIYVVRPNGKDLRKVSEFPGHHLACYDLEPSWSPGGASLVFAVLCDGGNLGIWRVDLGGGGRAQVVGTGHGDPLVAAYQPAWSPDGRRIAFVGVREKAHHRYESALYLVDRDGEGLAKLATDRGYGYGPEWSPDGTEISFWQYGHGMSFIHPNGSGEVHLDRFPGHACCLAWNPNA